MFSRYSRRECYDTLPKLYKSTAFPRANTIPVSFDVLLTAHLSIILSIDQLNAQILFYNKFIIYLYMFRALLCSSSGGQIVLYRTRYRHIL